MSPDQENEGHNLIEQVRGKEIETIEKTLGFHFRGASSSNKPLKIIYPGDPEFQHYSEGERRKEREGYFNPDTNIVVLEKESLQGLGHELTHAFISELSPEMNRVAKAALSLLRYSRESHRTLFRDVWTEGVCIISGRLFELAVQRGDGFDAKEEVNRLFEEYEEEQKLPEDGQKEPEMEDSLGKIKDYINATSASFAKSLFSVNSPEKVQEMYVKETMNGVYHVGQVFVLKVIHYLMNERNVKFVDTIHWIMRNPPSAISDLTNPEAFVERRIMSI